LGQEKPWCFIFSAKQRYEEDFFERISTAILFLSFLFDFKVDLP
jgi:hypothetical protein